MNRALQRQLSLRVADIMNRPVVTVSQNETMATAAQRMVEHSISGLPVLDEHQRCQGILSATDFVRRAGCSCHEGGICQKLEPCNGHGPLQIDTQAEDLVRDYMSPAVQGVSANLPLLTAARMMCAEHVHRLPVLDEQGRLLGMVTALDVVAAMVNSMEE